MEPRFNEVAGDRPNLFIKWRVRYIEVLFHTFYCNFGRDIEIISFVISRTSLNRGSLNRGSTVYTITTQQNLKASLTIALLKCRSGLFFATGSLYCQEKAELKIKGNSTTVE